MFVHLCAIKGFVDTRSGLPAAPVWLWLTLTRPADLKQLPKRHSDNCKTVPPPSLSRPTCSYTLLKYYDYLKK